MTAAVLNSAVAQFLFSADVSIPNGLGAADFAPEVSKKLSYTNGVSAGQADLIWTSERTLNASASEDIDLAGVLTDIAGATITNVEIAGIAIISDATALGVLTVGGGSNPWITWLIATGDGIKVPPGGLFTLFGIDATALGAVTAGTGDILHIANSSGGITKYKIIVLGRTA